MTKSRKLIVLAAAATFLVAGLLAVSVAIANEADDFYQKGLLALERKDAEAAIDALEHARRLAPEKAEIYHQLGRAHDLNGSSAESALAFYRQAVRLAPKGVGRAAAEDEARLRRRWVRVELDVGEEETGAGRHREARTAFERAIELSGPGLKAERRKAVEGYLRSASLELAATILKLKPDRPKVCVKSLAGGGVPSRPAAVIEEALLGALRSKGPRKNNFPFCPAQIDTTEDSECSSALAECRAFGA
ncbi:hypothetical protein ACFL59_11620 [Planctomycetota bacterium]